MLPGRYWLVNSRSVWTDVVSAVYISSSVALMKYRLKYQDRYSGGGGRLEGDDGHHSLICYADIKHNFNTIN